MLATIDDMNFTHGDFKTSLKRSDKGLHFHDRSGHNFSFQDGSGSDLLILHPTSDHSSDIQVAYGTVNFHEGGGKLVASPAFRGPDDPILLVAGYVQLLVCQLIDKKHGDRNQKIMNKVGGAVGKAIGKALGNAAFGAF